MVAGATAYFTAQRLDLGAQAGRFQSVLDGDRELVEIKWLADEVVSAELEGGLYVVQLRVSGDHDDRARVVVFLDLFEDVDTAGVRQTHVQQHEVGALVMRYAKRSRAVVSLQNAISPLFALLPE